MKISPRVAVILHQNVAWLAECVEGIREYARQAGDWHLLNLSPGFQRFHPTASLPNAGQWKGDGIIALVDDPRELRAAAKGRTLVVNLGSWHAESFGIPRVIVDHHKGGEQAAEHLLGLGLRNLAVFGWSDAWYLRLRQQGFCHRARRAGVKPLVKTESSREEAGRSWFDRISQVVRWMRALPRPCGVFAMHDYMAQLIVEACHEAGLRIPDDISLLGMDNDETVCEHLIPKLSSVGRSSRKVGWEAAALLDRLMRGDPPPHTDTLVSPSGVIARASTAKLYSPDPLVQQALDRIQTDLHTPFNIEQLAEALGVSKRTLENRFRQHLQTSPHEFLTLQRIRQAQETIRRTPGQTLEQIAAESGFASAQVLRKAFLRVSGETIGDFRRKQPGSKSETRRV